jgi:hypothetical protein
MLHIIIILALIGLALWAINTYVPMQPTIKKILNIAVIVLVVLWLLNVFGLLSNFGDISNIHYRQ